MSSPTQSWRTLIDFTRRRIIASDVRDLGTRGFALLEKGLRD